MQKLISVVIPVYREENNIQALFNRLQHVANSNSTFDWEFIFVNDGSPDGSLNILTLLADKHQNVKVVDFSRNFGKEVALTAGVLEAGKADAVICIDADLQHPPEVIPMLIDKWQNGADIVATIRKSLDKQPLLRKLGSNLYYRLINSISDFEMISQTTDFRLYDQKVITAFSSFTERKRLFRGIMDWMGFRKDYVCFEAPARLEGNSSFSYTQLLNLALNSITSFSLWPLKICGFLGFVITISTVMMLIWMIGSYLFYGVWVYTQLAVAVVLNTFLIGIVLMSIGLVALYIGTIHTEVINRPLFIVRDKINFENQSS